MAEHAHTTPTSTAHPDRRTIRRALLTLQRLPAEALADLTERLVDRLDDMQPDPDLEPEHDACDAGECGGVSQQGDGQPGDSTDAEPDDDDRGDGEDEPRFSDSLRPRRDGLIHVRRQTIMAVLYRDGRRPRPQRMRCIRWEASR